MRFLQPKEDRRRLSAAEWTAAGGHGTGLSDELQLKDTGGTAGFYGGSFTGLEEAQQRQLLSAAAELKARGLDR